MHLSGAFIFAAFSEDYCARGYVFKTRSLLCLDIQTESGLSDINLYQSQSGSTHVKP